MAQLAAWVVFKSGRKSVRTRALLDTGAEMTMLSSDQVKKLKLKRIGGGYIVGAGGQVTIGAVKVSSIEIPGTRCSSGPMVVAVFDERAFPMGGLTGLGAIVGLDFMVKTKMNIVAAAKTRMISCGQRIAQTLSALTAEAS